MRMKINSAIDYKIVINLTRVLGLYQREGQLLEINILI